MIIGALKSLGSDKNTQPSNPNGESGGQTPQDFVETDLEDGSLVQDSTKLNVTLATDVEGWDKSVNEQFLRELANNPQVKVTGFVPRHTPKQKEHARDLNIELVHAKKGIVGFSAVELLAYPPDDLDIDILIIHSYGRDLGKQAQIIKETKKCLWVNVVHTVSEYLEKILVNESTDPAANNQISEEDLQISLCEKSDLILAIGPIVAEAYRSALQLRGIYKNVIDLTPGIIEEFLDVRQETNSSGKDFHVLLSASSKYFKVKGCDIATEAINLLKDSSYRLIFVRQPKDNVNDLKRELKISENQLTIEKSSRSKDFWPNLLRKVDLVIKPSRTEGFGMSGLRAITADLPVLVSRNCGLGRVLQSLSSGAQHVIDSEDPKVWANAIKAVRAKAVQVRREESEQLRNDYMQRFNWKKQWDEIVKEMFSMNAHKSEGQKEEENNKDKKGTARGKRGTKGKERISKKEGEGTKQIGGGTTGKRGRRWPVRWIRLCFKPIESDGQTPQDFEATDLKGKRSIPPDCDNKQNPPKDLKQCVEHIEEYDQAIEVQQYETEAMVNEERAPENVNPRSQEPRLVTERKINQAEGKGNEEMEDAPQRGAQELSIVTGKFQSKKMDYKENVEIVQDRTLEVSHAAAKDVNKKKSKFDRMDSEERSIPPDCDNKQNPPDLKQCVEHIEEYDQAIEVQQYETEAMVNEERAPENVNPRSQEPRLVTEKEINQTEGKANEEMEDAPHRGAQELRIVTGRFESKRMDFKEKVEVVQDRTQEVSHAAVKDVNKTRIGFDQVDSEERSIPPDCDNKQNPPEDLKQCVEHIEEYDQAIEVQQHETEAMVNEERAPENVNPGNQELRLVTGRKINQTEGKGNEEMEDAPQRGAQELSIVTGKFESKRMDHKEKVEIVQDRTQEVSHAAAKDVNKKRSEFDQVDSEGAALDGVNDGELKRDQTGQLVKVQDIHFSVLSKICKKLNNKDELSFADFRLLGKKMGFDKDLIKDLELKINPTYELLQMWHSNPNSTVENLLMILKDDEMGRWDVATILEDWLKKKD